jgi:hypothetical protein
MSITNIRYFRSTNMGRVKIWDAQFQIKWLDSWVARLRVVAEAGEEDAASIVRRAAEREIEKREKMLGIVPSEK